MVVAIPTANSEGKARCPAILDSAGRLLTAPGAAP